MSKLKAFADNKGNFAKITISLFDRIENTVGKGENAGYKHFRLFPQSFLKPSYLGSSKVGIVWKSVKLFLDFVPEMKKKDCGNIQ